MARKSKSKTPITDLQRTSDDWNSLWTLLHDWNPDFLEAYLALRNVPIRNGPLPAKFKELILVAINAATTHLYAPGVRRHIQNALQKGAMPDEILEVIQLTTLLGIHSSNLAVPILAEEVAERDARHAKRSSK